MSNDWKVREHNRQYDGSRTMPVWWQEPWYYISSACRCAADGSTVPHFLHVSQKDPALLAYTESEEKGERDIQTQIRPGRYLRRYFGDVLTEKQIAYYAAWQATGRRASQYDSAEAFPLAFADTQETIGLVYADGPYSCMSGLHFTHDNHPCRVYAAGDLAVAYLTNAKTEKVVARSLVWPAKKLYGRVYPSDNNYHRDGFGSQSEAQDCADALANRLQAEGYQSIHTGVETFSGARILKIERRRGGYVMPYMDHGYGVDDMGDHFVMRPDGDCEIRCDNTDGTLPDSHNETCENCGDGVDEEELAEVYTRCNSDGGRGGAMWCESCRDRDSFYCEGFNETFSDDVAHDGMDGYTYTVVWLEENAVWSDYSERWIDRDDAVTMADGSIWSQRDFERHGFTCAITGDNYPKDEEHADHSGVWEGCTDQQLRDAGYTLDEAAD